MFSIAYHKESKKLMMARYDSASSAGFTPQQHLDTHCDNNDLDANDFIAIEHPYDKKFQIIMGNHVFNETTRQIEADPNWVAPTLEPTESTV